MAVAIETVVKQLEDSGIVAAGKLEQFLPPKAHPKDVDALVAELVKEKHLTKFQAVQVAAGRAKSLILGGYTIVDKIGAGGMGQVFKAEHRRMKRVVAIKTLPAGTMKDPAVVARFQREVEAAAKLRHTNIVAADDADEANGVHFLVMEYVEGKDLSATVKKDGPFPVAKAVNYVLQAARGLEFAHSEGVVHRDIKPANLLLDKKGVVKILDMGLARIEQHGNVAAQAELTGTGTIMGTVDYMAPEQGTSTKHADARADIYSLGCTLYYLIAGKATYAGETIAAKLVAHHTHPLPDLRKANAEVSEQLDAVFKKMIAKRVEDRYQTMTDVIADLEQCKERETGDRRQEAGTSGVGSFSGLMPTIVTDAPIIATNQSPPTKPAISASARVSRDAPRSGSGKNSRPPTKLIAAGLGGFALLAALGVWIVVKNKNGDEVARIAVPDGGGVTVQPTSNPPPAAVVPGVQPTSTPSAASFFGGSTTPAPSFMPTTPTQPAAPGVLGTPIDLLAQFDAARDDPKGTWAKENSSLKGSGTLKLFFPQAVPEEYDLDAEIDLSQRHQKGLALGFLTGGRQPTLVMDIDGVWVLSDVHGMTNSHLSNPTRVTDLPWPVNMRVPVKLSVRRDGVRVLFRDQQIIDWHGTKEQLSANSYFTNNARNSFFFHCGSPFTIYRLAMTPYVPATAAAAQVDLLPLVDLNQDVLSGQWTREGTELRSAATQSETHKLRLPVDPGEEYSLQLACAADRGYPKITLPFGSKGLVAALNADRVVLQLASSKLDNAGNPSSDQLRLHFGENKRCDVRIDVTRPAADQVRIVVFVGDEPVLDWSGTLEQIQASSGPDLTEPTLLFETYQTKAAGTKLFEAKLTTTRGRMKFLRGGAAAPIAPPAAPAIPDQALTFGGHRYLLVKEASDDFDAAQAKAAAMGGHLAAINTKEERDWVREEVWLKRPDQGNKDRCLTGGRISADRKSGTWITGEPVDLTLWDGDRTGPDNSGGEVSFIYITFAKGAWDDLPGDQRGGPTHYLVEWDTLGSAAIAPAAPQPTPIDLIALTDPVQDRFFFPNLIAENKWTRADGKLTYTTDGKAGAIVAPVSLTDCKEYEVEADVRRLSGNSVFTFNLPLASDRKTGVDVYIGGRIEFKLEGGNRKKLGDWPAAAGDGGHITIRVRLGTDGRIEMRVNDQVVAEWRGDTAKIGHPADEDGLAREQMPTSLFCFKDSFEFTSWKLTGIDGAPRVLRGPGAVAAAAPAKRRFASDEWIDVLPLIDPALDKWDIPNLTGANEWRLENGELVIGRGDAKPAKLLLPLDVQGLSTECEVEFTRLRGDKGVNIDVPVASGPCPMIYDRDNDGRALLGKSGIPLSGKVEIENGERNTIRLVVRRVNGVDELETWFNGASLGTWKGNRNDIAYVRAEGYPHDRRISLWMYGDLYVFHRIRFRMLDGGTAESLRPIPPTDGR